MRLNLKKINSIKQIQKLCDIQHFIEVNCQKMDTVINQSLQWALNNGANYKYTDDETGIIFVIQHGMLKQNWQNLSINDRLKEQVYPQYCEIRFFNCNGIFLVLTTGFVDPHRNLIWKLGQISYNTVKNILFM